MRNSNEGRELFLQGSSVTNFFSPFYTNVFRLVGIREEKLDVALLLWWWYNWRSTFTINVQRKLLRLWRKLSKSMRKFCIPFTPSVHFGFLSPYSNEEARFERWFYESDVGESFLPRWLQLSFTIGPLISFHPNRMKFMYLLVREF